MALFYDADESPAELRLRGNDSYKCAKFEEAIEIYSQVIALDGSGADAGMALGNRSACYLSLKKWCEAAEDARAALLHTPDAEKYYYRLVTALRGSGDHTEAQKVLEDGLKRLPASAVLCKLAQNLVLAKKTDKAGGPSALTLTKSWGSLGRDVPLFCEPCEPSPAEGATSLGVGSGGGITAALVIETSTEASYSVVEYQMLQHARDLVKRIQRGEASAIQGKGHILVGLFAKVCSKTGFAEVMFPGTSPEERTALPKDLRELLLWPELVLDLTGVAQSAAKVLVGAKTRGEANGDVMDKDTQNMLSPQIVQEALVRSLEVAVRQRTKNISRVAHSQLPIASVSAPQADLEQLDEEVTSQLHNSGMARQSEFLGPEWSALVGQDLLRFTASEHMSDLQTSEPGLRLVTGRTPVRLAWLDRSYEQYPALNEAIDKLLALPYEVNKDAVHHGRLAQLMEPASKVLLLHYRPLSSQPHRLDCGTGDADSGIRLTCSYHLVPTLALHAAELRCGGIATVGQAKTQSTVEVKDDLLVLHASRDVHTERSAATTEYFVLCFYAHGTHGTDKDAA